MKEALMSLNEGLKSVGVIGAAGKMGRGISLLFLQELTRCDIETGSLGKGEYHLHLIDPDEKGLDGLKRYLRVQLMRYAEKNINVLRKLFENYPNIISNQEIVEAFVVEAFDIVYFSTSLEDVKNSMLIFEAVVESVDLKCRLYEQLNALCDKKACFFSNTSSIPISFLDQKCQLNHRIIGFHFYNPPAVQKLVEIIPSGETSPELKALAYELARRLGKIIVESSDVAGFIGNGHFIREVLFACKQVEELTSKCSVDESIYIVNKITQDFLLRPMGIFQLVDYVGIDVVYKICRVMSDSIPHANFYEVLIERMVKAGIVGGQHGDGSQKNGFFAYRENVPIAVYSLQEMRYRDFNEGNWKARCDEMLGFIELAFSWKCLLSDKDKQTKISMHFENLFHDLSLGAELTKAWLIHSTEISNQLVKDRVAPTLEAVSMVLKNGFYHLYAPYEVTFKRDLDRAVID